MCMWICIAMLSVHDNVNSLYVDSAPVRNDIYHFCGGLLLMWCITAVVRRGMVIIAEVIPRAVFDGHGDLMYRIKVRTNIVLTMY